MQLLTGNKLDILLFSDLKGICDIPTITFPPQVGFGNKIIVLLVKSLPVRPQPW